MGLQQIKSQTTHDAIITAAQLAFAEGGYDAASIATICREAGISKGAFYHHFSSKQALFIEILELWLTQLDIMLNELSSQGLGVPETITAMASFCGQIIEEGQDRLPLILTFWQQAQKEEAIWQRAFAPFDRYRIYFADLIQRGLDEGSLMNIDPNLGAQTLISLVVGLLLQSLMDKDTSGWCETASKCIQQVLLSWQNGDERKS